MQPGSIENFFFDDVHFSLVDTVKDLARTRCAAIRDQFERHEISEDDAARAFVRTLASAGLLDLCIPEDFGGRFPVPDLRSICIVREQLSYESGFADTSFILQGLGAHPLALAALQQIDPSAGAIQAFEPAAEWLPRVIKGEAIAAFAVTEPEAGSDLGSAQCAAVPHRGGYSLNGRKIYISNAGVADFYTVLAREGGGADHKQLAMYLVPAHTPGVSVRRMQVIGPHPIGEVHFNDAHVPEKYKLCEAGAGLKLALANLDLFRTSVAAAACGLAKRALDDAARHVKQRIQFGKPLAEQQLTRAAIAEMATDLDAARLLTYRAAASHDRGASRLTVPISMAKWFATEAAQRIIDRSLQLHGGLGVTVGTPVERLYREVRALRIYEGTSEIQQLVIARGILESGSGRG